jgi:hypothetical protein
MNRSTVTPIVRALVAMLALAVLLCLVLPMTMDAGSEMNMALFCCFVLAIVLGVFVLRRPGPKLVFGYALGGAFPHPPLPLRTARAPDVVELGSLLI